MELVDVKKSSPEIIKRLLIAGGSLCLEPKLALKIHDFDKISSEYNQHIWISSSGTSNKKLIALSQKALLASASAVNQHFKVKKSDNWALALPLNHIAGFSIIVRALQSGFQISHYKDSWNPVNFCSFLAANGCTLASLVPTQLYDILINQISAPPSLRAVAIGGASLSDQLYSKAIELGWPIVPSYGLTECCSMVACANLDLTKSHSFSKYKILSHLECSVDQDNVLSIKGSSLLSAYFQFDSSEVPNLQRFDPKCAFETNDLAKLEVIDNCISLEILGRKDRQIKIKGWLIALDPIEKLIAEFISSKSLQILFSLGYLEDPRNGNSLILHVTRGSKINKQLEELNQYILTKENRFPGIAKIVEHTSFPTLANAKIDLAALNNLAI